MSQQVMNPLPSETHLFLKMLEIIFFFLKKILPSLAATKAIWPTVHCLPQILLLQRNLQCTSSNCKESVQGTCDSDYICLYSAIQIQI